MEEIQRPDNLGAHFEQDEISLLDILVTLAENAKLLIIGPLLVGLSALGVGYMQPPFFESVAMLQAEQATASLMTTAIVLDPVVAKLGLAKDASAEEARGMLRGQIKAAVGSKDKLLVLTVSAPTPQQAQAIAVAVLEQTYVQSRPKGRMRVRYEEQLAEAQGHLLNVENIATSLHKRLKLYAANSAGGNEMARSYADLLSAAGVAQTQVNMLESRMDGVSEAQLVQAPTLPQKASQLKKAQLAIVATLVTGLALLLFIFMRQALRNTVADVEAARKWARICRALGLS